MLDDFNINIVRILSEEHLNRTVKVELIQDFYDGRKQVTLGFFKDEWEKFKHDGYFSERRALTERDIAYFEEMSESDWYAHRYTINISRFSNQELIDEVNRRLKLSALSGLVIGKIELSATCKK